MSERTFKLIYLLFFGLTAGLILSYGVAFFLPQVYPESIGKMVCQGKVEFFIFKQAYFCFISTNNYFDITDAMFWVVFKRAILPSIAFAIVFGIIFVKVARFLWHRRAAAGF